MGLKHSISMYCDEVKKVPESGSAEVGYQNCKRKYTTSFSIPLGMRTNSPKSHKISDQVANRTMPLINLRIWSILGDVALGPFFIFVITYHPEKQLQGTLYRHYVI